MVRILATLISLFLFFHVISCSKDVKTLAFVRILKNNWEMQSAQTIHRTGAQLTQPAFRPETWYKVQLPSTVLAGLVANHLYEDMYKDRNLESIPTEAFTHAWWFRTRFDLPEWQESSVTRLRFNGINYRANIWLNGVQIASADSLFGPFRVFDINVSALIQKHANLLAIEVFPPEKGDFTIGFVDWNPKPPDKNMGVWRNVEVLSTGNVAIERPFVHSDIHFGNGPTADVHVETLLQNYSRRTVSGVLQGKLSGTAFEVPVVLKAGERKPVHLNPENVPELRLASPKLWWPAPLGKPNLYHLQLRFVTNDTLSDAQSVRFGLRKVESYFTKEGYRGFKINGRKVLIRGAGWTDDLLLADTPEKTEAQVRYVKQMRLNTIRLEGFWGKDQTLYDLCDQYGIMIMTGWSCQWEWESYLGKACDRFGGIATEADMNLADRSWQDQLALFRNHASVIAWLSGSDMLPRPALERRYLSALKKMDSTRVYLAAASERISTLSGPTGVKMNGPYDYVPPVYWYQDTTHGGAFGFNTETGPGPQPPPLESLRRMISNAHLWPMDKVWEYHCGRNEFNTLNRYTNALAKRYGPPADVADFTRTAQIASYEAIRPMFESFAAHKFRATGVVQWMLNSAWPEMYWQLYDYYLMPNGAFYGARKANAPLQLIYDYANSSIILNNDYLQKQDSLTAIIRLFDRTSKELLHQEIFLSAAANQAKTVFKIPALQGSGNLFFLDVRLKQNKESIASNFYWLSKQNDQMDYPKSTWFVTPQSRYADLKGLRSLPQTRVRYSFSRQHGQKEDRGKVTLENLGNHIAFGLRLLLLSAGEPLLPVYWNDNYISLLPGEKRVVTVSYPSGHGAESVQLSGWNVQVVER